MDFAFSDEQNAIRETARRFAADRLAPGYKAREQAGRIGEELTREMGALGLIGVDVPEEYGGLGLDRTTTGIVAEEIGRADHSVCYAVLNGSLLGSMISRHARPELAREVLAPMCRGESLIAIGLTEPRGGSDAAGLILKARRDGNAWRLNGEKTSISLANQAREIVVMARTGEVEERARGVTAFVVPMDAPGSRSPPSTMSAPGPSAAAPFSSTTSR